MPFYKNNEIQAGLTYAFSLKPTDFCLLIFSSLIINLFSLVVPIITFQVYDRILSFQSVGTLQTLTAGAAIIIIMDVILKLARTSMTNWAAARFEHAAFSDTLEHLMRSKLLSLGQYSPGEQLQRINAIAKLKSFYSGQSLINIVDLPFVLIFLGFIAYLADWLVLVPLVLLAAFGLYALFLSKEMNKSLVLRDEDDDKRINFISEILDNIHTVKMLGLEKAFQRRHENLQKQNVLESYNLSKQNSQSYNAAALFTQIMMVSMVAIGALIVLDGQITMGVLIACVLVSGRIMQPIQRTLSFWISFQEYHLANKKVGELMRVPEQSIIDEKSLNPAKGRVDIQKLNFSYDNQNAIFKNLDLKLEAGDSVALVHSTGVGRTTFMKLLAGLYEPTSGQILIDGTETSHIPKTRFAQYVGYLPPNSDIFQGTIMDNLTGFRPEMEEKAFEMAGYLGIDKVVSKLAHGYETELFDGPADPITPGMKQRITIARILINRPRIILFDRADSSLDKEGYNHLFRLMGQLKGQATMIIISNDRNILHLAEREYLITDGKLELNKDVYKESDNIVTLFKEFRE